MLVERIGRERIRIEVVSPTDQLVRAHLGHYLVEIDVLRHPHAPSWHGGVELAPVEHAPLERHRHTDAEQPRTVDFLGTNVAGVGQLAPDGLGRRIDHDGAFDLKHIIGQREIGFDGAERER